MGGNDAAEGALAGLERAVEAEPDPAWVSRDTGVALGDWAAVPPDGSFDALEWRVPDRLRRLAHVSPLDLTEPVAIPADAGPDESPEQRPHAAKATDPAPARPHRPNPRPGLYPPRRR